MDDEHVERLVPVWVERLLDHTRGVRLLGVYRDDRERVGEAEDIALRKAIRGDDCSDFSLRMWKSNAGGIPVMRIFFLRVGQQLDGNATMIRGHVRAVVRRQTHSACVRLRDSPDKVGER
jgi:hypothetical protein